MAKPGEPGPLTLSREDLYELVWSKPMVELAKDFEISDVGLAKRCKAMGVPVPGRGYWARFDAGQSPYRPELPKRESKWSHGDTLTVPVPEIEPDDPESPMSGDPSAMRDRVGSLAITTSTSLFDALSAVKRTAWHLKHPRRSELALERGEKMGPVISMTVSTALLDRALLVADMLLRAADVLGWTFAAPPPPPPPNFANRAGRMDAAGESSPPPPKDPPGELVVNGERVGFCIEERLRDESREPSAAELAREKREYRYRAPRKVQVPTGKLRIVRLDTYRQYGAMRQSWYDRKGCPVEEQLKEVLVGFYELSRSIKARRAEHEREERERREQERLQKEREARQAANAKLITQLETDAGAWHRARYLRRYIQAARRILGQESIRARFRKESVDFLSWAEGYVDQLDPLGAQPRSEDFESRQSGYAGNDLERMKASFARLLGSEWESAWKTGVDYTPEEVPPSERWRVAYQKRSVFEVGGSEEDDELTDD